MSSPNGVSQRKPLSGKTDGMASDRSQIVAGDFQESGEQLNRPEGQIKDDFSSSFKNALGAEKEDKEGSDNAEKELSPTSQPTTFDSKVEPKVEEELYGRAEFSEYDPEKEAKIADRILAAFNDVTPKKEEVVAQPVQPDVPRGETVQRKAAENLQQIDSKRKPLLKFMASMESELGVEPQRLLKAMAELSDQELMSPPSTSMSSVLDKLALEPLQRQRAEVLYGEMLEKIDRGDLKQQMVEQNFPDKMLGGEATILNSDRPIEEVQAESVQKLSDRFFLNDRREPFLGRTRPRSGEQEQYPISQGLFEPLPRRGEGKEFFPPRSRWADNSPQTEFSKPTLSTPSSETYSGGEGAVRSNPMHLLKEQESLALAREYSQPSAIGMERPVVKAEWADMGQSRGLSQMEPPVKGESYLANLESGFSGSTSDWLSENSYQAKEQSSGQILEQGSPETFDGELSRAELVEAWGGEAERANLETSEGDDGLEALERIQNTLKSNSSGKVNKSEASMLNHGPAKTDESANVEEVVQRAHLLSRKGGGEMKIQLKPEGLGNVHLKVNVADGDVNVQMVTETAEAKRLLEQGVGDLKSTLGQQKLNLDMLKVDVGNDANTESEKFQFSQARDDARSFLGSFRHAQQEFRDGMFEIPGIKGYRKADNLPDLREDGKKKSSDKNRRLDLVA
jgi:flagellar hook-length control protein FliK